MYSIVTFYTKDYTTRALRLRESVVSDPLCNNCYMYTEDDLNFKTDIDLGRTRGYGYMCWKPYVILKALGEMEEGELLIYIDADIELIDQKLLQKLLQKVNSSMFFYVGEFKEKNYTQERWTKMDTFIKMKEASEEQFKNYQIMSGLQIYRKNADNVQFLQKVLEYCLDSEVISDNIEPERIGVFQGHRHDQSILSILVNSTKVNLKKDIHIVPTQFGKNDKLNENVIGEIGEYMYIFKNHGTMGEIVPKELPLVTVITPTTLHTKLEQAIESVQNQTYQNIEHVIVLDKPEKQKELEMLIKKYKNKKRRIYTCVLPYNTGANGWNGHRIYGGMPHLLHHSEYISFLDEDNWFEDIHISTLVDEIVTKKLTWAYSLRNIIEDDKYVCKDLCESLGGLSTVFESESDRLIDTSCYLMKRELAMKTSFVWNIPARSPQGEADRQLCNLLLSQVKNNACTRKFTLNYRTSNTPNSVNSLYFKYGNDKMSKKWKGNIPWENENVNGNVNEIVNGNGNGKGKDLYIFHFTPDATRKYFDIKNGIGNVESHAYDEWQMTLLDSFEYNLINGYETEDTIPKDAMVLVHLCLPQYIPLKTLSRNDITRIGYTVEGPNIRHKAQWDKQFLEMYFDKILTYWTPLLETSSKTYFCPFIHRINFKNPLDTSWIYENKHFEKTMCMILEYRTLQGDYEINGVSMKCLDPLRGIYANVLTDYLTVYGQNWDKFNETREKKIKIGHSLGKSRDTRANVEIMKDYTFNLIIENCDGEDYVSEKFCDALVAGCIPVYYGNIGKRMEKLIPKDIYIDLKKYKTPEKFERIFNQMGIKEIIRMKNLIKQKRNSILKSLGPESYFDYFKEIKK